MLITLPFPPSVNHAYPSRRGGGRYKSKAYGLWLSRCPNLPKTGICHPVHIEYKFFMPDKRIRDLSNYIKVTEDYLVSSGLLVDDNWNVINSFAVSCAGIDKGNPRVEIEIDEGRN